ncbi:uncharacterized protein LOC109818205 [Cajanus cajan]|uniref:uncharacterized protein LOC109818205 n=1 Tax=Cajanus cajan TaxID=3821 RepID=UPI00098D8669|nr:uncharacterized protein LOC109818205 [Cajanus cajan]
MRCFLPCFRTSKRRNQSSSADATPTQTRVGEEPVVQELIDCIAELKIKNEEQSNNSAGIIKDEHEKTSKEDENKDGREEEDDEINKRSHQEESSESLFSLSICSRKQVSDADVEVNSAMQFVGKREHVSSLLSPGEKFSQEQQPSSIAIKKEQESSANEPINKLDENEGEKEKANHPVPHYRYRDCHDEGYDDINLDESDLDATVVDDDDRHSEKREKEEESSESLFSLSADSRIRISSAEEAENEVNSLMPLPDHGTKYVTQKGTKGKIQDVSSVLNPIENLTQGRIGKETVLQPLKKDKENMNLVVQDVNIPISPEPSLKVAKRKPRQKLNDKKEEIEIGVDTSLSSWLAESETTPKGRRGSPWSHEERPILGALTVDEIRMFSISISPKKSSSRSPDETPIIGTVGSYWSHTEQSMELEFNKSGKDLKRGSTALQARLEQAFEASVSEV